MPKLFQTSFTAGEVSPSLHARVDLQRFQSALKTCRNFFVRPQGGVSNRAGTRFVSRLNAESNAALIPFVRSEDDAYMIVLQEETARVFKNGAFVTTGTTRVITGITYVAAAGVITITVTSAAHAFSAGATVVIVGVVSTFGFNVNTSFTIESVTTNTFVVSTTVGAATGAYTSGGLATASLLLVTPFQSEEVQEVRFTQSADVMTLVHRGYFPSEIIRTSATEFTYATISDIDTGPFLDINDSATTVTSSAASGSGVTLTASTSIFNQSHVGSLISVHINDLSAIPPWEAGKSITAGDQRSANGKVYEAANSATTGSVPPSHDEGSFLDGAGGVEWDFLHPLYGVARITAVTTPALKTITNITSIDVYPPYMSFTFTTSAAHGFSVGNTVTVASVTHSFSYDVNSVFTVSYVDSSTMFTCYVSGAFGGSYTSGGTVGISFEPGTVATADVIDYLPVVSPATTTKWAFGAWSEDQGYPGVVTYFGDRLVFASTLERPQDQYASKTGDYHNFSVSSPVVDDDAITQTLNSRRTNAIVELIPLEQLISLTANSSWASPQRGEVWTPETIGFYAQSGIGSADLPAVTIGEGAIFAERFGTRLRAMSFANERDKFGGDELTVLARHLFEEGTIVDMDYAEYPDGILWVVRSDGALIGLTYLPEQEVIAFSRHDTNGYFERVCVIPEDGVDATYFVVRRTLGDDSEVRYLERLADRSNDVKEGFFVDCGLTYDGRNTTATTITATGASYDGGATVTLTASAAIFASTDTDDAIQFGDVTCLITGYTSTTVVTAELQSPLGASLQAVATTEWTFARNTFSGLDHLEGLLITGLADGNVIDPDDTTTDGIVTSGQIVLTAPAGVVHIGLPYTQEIQTLTLNVPGGAQIRDNNKLVPKVSVVVEKTTGLRIGHDADNMEELESRSFENYTVPATQTTGALTGYILNTWDKDSSVIIQQPYCKPANILAVIPTVIVGNNG